MSPFFFTMADVDDIAALRAEVEQLRKVVADQAAALAAHAERERAERERKEARSRVNRQNYERRKASQAIQMSDSDRIQTLNPPPLDGSPLPSAPSFPSPLSSPQTSLSAAADLQSVEAENADGPQATLFSQPSAAPKERPEDLQALWNSEAHPCLPRWKEMPDTRKRKAASRLRERTLAEWREVIQRINASAFCRGEQGDWRASPDWILQTDTAAKVLEGKYLKAGEAPVQPSEAPKRRVITM